MPGKAAVVGVSDKPWKVLTKRSVSRSEAPMWIQRARIIRRAHAGESNAMIAEAVGLNRTDVGQWRCRWRDTPEPLAALELREPQRLTEAIRETLREAPRSGCGGTFTAEPVTRIQALAGEQPSVSGRPITHEPATTFCPPTAAAAPKTLAINCSQPDRTIRGCATSVEPLRPAIRRTHGVRPILARGPVRQRRALASRSHRTVSWRVRRQPERPD